MFKIGLAIFLSWFSIYGQIYFSHSQHPNHGLYQVLCILLIPVSIALSFYGRQDILDKKRIRDMEAVRPLKKNGEKIIVDIENCRFNGNNFDVPVTSRPMISTHVPVFGEPVSLDEIQQSVLTYQHAHLGRTELFISQVFPIDLITLEAHIMQKHLILYIDKKDRSHFYFDLQDSNIQSYEAEL
jgi:hypothetical protein